jgi:hypothetical protein
MVEGKSGFQYAFRREEAITQVDSSVLHESIDGFLWSGYVFDVSDVFPDRVSVLLNLNCDSHAFLKEPALRGRQVGYYPTRSAYPRSGRGRD